MVIYYLGIDEVRAYLTDFLARLHRITPRPVVWCPITRSGNKLLGEMLPLVSDKYPELVGTVSVVAIGLDEKNGAAKLDDSSKASDIAGKPVLLFDGAIHGGKIMTRCVSEVIRLGASDVCTYALAMKRGSTFIPTMWGLMIEDSDRVFFQLDEIPNNRLDAGNDKPGKPPLQHPCVHIRVLCKEHLNNPLIKCGVDSLDRVTWDDRLFNMTAGEHRACTYVLQTKDEIAGYLTLEHTDPRCLLVTEIVIDQKLQGNKAGSILMRFADTVARQSGCTAVRLNAIKERVGWYEGFGYKTIPGREPLKLGKEEYVPMEHLVVRNQFGLH